MPMLEVSRAGATYDTAERASREAWEAKRATPEMAARHDDFLRERNAQEWFHSEALRFRRGLDQSAPVRLSEGVDWVRAASWAARLHDLMTCATAATKGLLKWSEAKAMFDRMDLGGPDVEVIAAEAVKAFAGDQAA